MARIHKMPGVLPQQRSLGNKRKRVKLPLLVIAVGLLCGVYWIVFVGPLFVIHHVEMSGIENESVRTVSSRLVGQNIFRISTLGLNQELKQVHPPIDKVTVVRGLPHTVRLEVSLRTPVLRWQAANGVFILDSTGESFAQGETEAYSALPKVIDSSGIPLQVGQEIVSPSFIGFIQEIQPVIPTTLKRQVTSYEVNGTTYHLDVLLENDIRVKVSIQRPAKEQLEAAQLILNSHPDIHLIDVRIPGVGYYK